MKTRVWRQYKGSACGGSRLLIQSRLVATTTQLQDFRQRRKSCKLSEAVCRRRKAAACRQSGAAAKRGRTVYGFAEAGRTVQKKLVGFAGVRTERILMADSKKKRGLWLCPSPIPDGHRAENTAGQARRTADKPAAENVLRRGSCFLPAGFGISASRRSGNPVTWPQPRNCSALREPAASFRTARTKHIRDAFRRPPLKRPPAVGRSPPESASVETDAAAGSRPQRGNPGIFPLSAVYSIPHPQKTRNPTKKGVEQTWASASASSAASRS